MTLRVSTTTDVDGLRRLTGDWRSLLERVRPAVPFVSPEWLIPWWESFRQERWSIADSLYVKQVRTESGELVALLPCFATDRPRHGPFRLRVVSFLGADRYLSELRMPLVDPAYEAEVAFSLSFDLQRDPTWDWITWTGLQKESSFARGLEQAMNLEFGEAATANLIPLPDSWDTFRAGLKRNIKESLRHGYNSLKRDGHTPTLVVAESPGDVAAALDTFFRLHAVRAGQTGTVEHPDRFESPMAQRFLRTACARLAEKGMARVFTLVLEGTPAAVRVGFLLPEGLYLYYSGFDPAWAKYGVMTTAVAEIIKYAIVRKVPLIHLSMGVDVSKSRWGPEMPLYHNAISVRPRLRSLLAQRVYALGTEQSPLGDALRQVLPKRRFD